MAEKAIFFDSTRCTACKACQVSCKTWNLLPSSLEKNANKWSGSHQNPPDVNGETRLIMTFNEHDLEKRTANGKWVEWAFGRRACQHCTDAACVSICPAGAITIDKETGLVQTNDDKCIGCQYCRSACPFDVPRYHGEQTKMNKCTGCPTRVEHGRAPACVTTCQPHALDFGDRDAMLKLAHERMEDPYVKENFPNAVLYGEKEMGGLHVIQILKYGVEAHGQVKNPAKPATTVISEIMKPVTGVVSGAAVLGFGLMAALASGYSRRTLAYNEETGDTVDVNTGEVVKHGDGQDERGTAEAIFENLPDFVPGKKGVMEKAEAQHKAAPANEEEEGA